MEDFNNPLCKPYELEGHGDKAAHGVLVIHGFTGSPAQLRPMAESINARGYTVSGLLLPGHCTTLDDMARVSWSDYIDSVRAGYDALAARCEDVSVVGLSMGGLLSLIISAERDVRACAVLSAAVVQRNRLARLSPALRYVMPRVIRWPESAVNRGADFLHEYDYGYSGLPVRRVADLMRLSRMACGALSSVHCPLLVVQSWRDETVNPVSAEIIMRGAASERKRLVRLERSGHMITLGPEREQVWREVGEWLDAAQA